MNTLVAQERTDFKKSTLRKLRNDGEIPAVVYGSDIDTETISIKNTELIKVLKDVGRNGIISLELGGKAKDVILRDYQNDPVTKSVLHADFLQVNKNTEIDTKVSVILKGTSKGEKAGAISKQILHELDITAKANELPDNIEIDITNFEVGDGVQVAEIKKAYPNCTFNHDDEETIVTIDFVKAAAEEEEEEVTEAEASGV